MLRKSLVLLSLLALAGCSDPEPVNETVDGSLEDSDSVHEADGSFYDAFTFEAKEGWQINVEMTSSDFDTFVQLRRRGVDDGEFLEQNDDAVAGSPEQGSKLTLVAPANGTYVLWANSLSAGETGAYHLTYSAQPAAQ